MPHQNRKVGRKIQNWATSEKFIVRPNYFVLASNCPYVHTYLCMFIYVSVHTNVYQPIIISYILCMYACLSLHHKLICSNIEWSPKQIKIWHANLVEQNNEIKFIYFL